MTLLRLSCVGVVVVLLHAATIARAQSLPQDVQDKLGKVVGKWNVESKMGDVVMKDVFECEWSPGKDAVLYHCKGTGLVSGKETAATGIVGWDGEKKVLVELGVASTGEVFSTTIDISSDKWRSPTKATRLIDGKFKTEKCLRTFTWTNNDEWVVTGRKRTLDGEEQPDIVGKFTRVK